MSVKWLVMINIIVDGIHLSSVREVLLATLGSSHPMTMNMDKQLRKWNNGCLLFIRLELYSFRVSAVLPDWICRCEISSSKWTSDHIYSNTGMSNFSLKAEHQHGFSSLAKCCDSIYGDRLRVWLWGKLRPASSGNGSGLCEVILGDGVKWELEGGGEMRTWWQRGLTDNDD